MTQGEFISVNSAHGQAISVYLAYFQPCGQITILCWLFVDKSINKPAVLLTIDPDKTAPRQCVDDVCTQKSTPGTLIESYMLEGTPKPSFTKQIGTYNVLLILLG